MVLPLWALGPLRGYNVCKKYEDSVKPLRRASTMATPCNAQLQEAPFDTYRDPATGEWKLKYQLAAPATAIRNVIPFHRPTEPRATIISQAK